MERQEKRARTQGECAALDPVAYLPDLVLDHVFLFLSLTELSAAAAVSKAWNAACSSVYVWNCKLNALTSQLVQKPACLQGSPLQLHPRALLRMVLTQNRRQHITRSELTRMVWRFRFKQAAGMQWVQNDPYWTTGIPRHIRLNDDGTLVDIHNEHTVFNHFHWQMVRPFIENGQQCCTAVRVNDFPRYVVSRWRGGWIMQSAWVVWYSFPIAPYEELPIPLRDEGLNLTMEDEQQALEALLYNAGIQAEGLDDVEPRVNVRAFVQLLQALYDRERREDEDGNEGEEAEENVVSEDSLPSDAEEEGGPPLG